MVSDGCTAWVLSDWLNSIEPVYQCCVIHDDEYFRQIGRFAADWNLLTCVSHAGFPLHGLGMAFGVGLLGWHFYNKKAK